MQVFYPDSVFSSASPPPPPPTERRPHTLFPLSQMDHDPRNPTYISSQGPLPSTVADFWQVKLISTHSPSFLFSFHRFISAAGECLKEPRQSSYVLWMGFLMSSSWLKIV